MNKMISATTPTAISPNDHVLYPFGISNLSLSVAIEKIFIYLNLII